MSKLHMDTAKVKISNGVVSMTALDTGGSCRSLWLWSDCDCGYVANLSPTFRFARARWQHRCGEQARGGCHPNLREREIGSRQGHQALPGRSLLIKPSRHVRWEDGGHEQTAAQFMSSRGYATLTSSGAADESALVTGSKRWWNLRVSGL